MSANVPELRFSGFADPWEQRKLGEVCSIERGERFTAADYVESDGIPCIHYGEVYTDYGPVATEAISQVRPGLEGCLRYANPGDIILTSTSENVEDVCKAVAWMGKTQVSYHDDSFALSHSEDSLFLTSYFQTGGFSEQKAAMAHGVKVMRVSQEDLANISIPLPCLPEQRAVGALFSRLDSLIALHQRKHNQLSVLKSSLLERMFPKPGSDVPELRFSGFADPWEQRKLGELFVESDDRSSELEILSVSVRGGIYPASESDRTTNPGASIANYKVVHPGDIVYNSMRMWQGAVDSSIYRGIVSPAYVVARPMGGVDSRFFARLLKRPEMLSHYQRVSQGNSKDTLALKFEQFSQIDVSMPLFPREQMAIGELFDGLDSLIALHQRESPSVTYADD